MNKDEKNDCLRGIDLAMNTELTCNAQEISKEKLNEVIKNIDKMRKKRVEAVEKERLNKVIKKSSLNCEKTPLKQIAAKFKKCVEKSKESTNLGYIVDKDGVKKGKLNIIKSFENFWFETFQKKQTNEIPFTINEELIEDKNWVHLEKDDYLDLIKNLKNNKAVGGNLEGFRNQAHKQRERPTFGRRL